jgi:hypothetical protein
VRKRLRLIAVVAGIALASVVAYALWPGPNTRVGSVRSSSGTVNVSSRVPSAYRIVYRHEDRVGGGFSSSSEVFGVRRPFDARDETRRGGKLVVLTINGFARVNTGRALLAVPPAAANGDMRPDAFLGDAIRDGYALARERRRVAGRVCRVYRTAGESGPGSLPPVRDLRGNYIDRCFDASGLLLEEVSYVDGKLIDRRIATHVDEHPTFSDSDFDVGGTPIGAKVGGGSVKELTPDSRPPGSFWELPRPPAGFAHKGRYAVIPPQSELTDPQKRTSIVATVDDVWVHGPDLLIVRQGGTLGGGEPFGKDANARRVSVGALGSGDLLYALRSSQVRVSTGKGHFVVVEGTLAPARLLAIARSLVKGNGGALTVR